MVDAEDNCCLEEKVDRVPTETGVYVVQVVLNKICDLLYCSTAGRRQMFWASS